MSEAKLSREDKRQCGIALAQFAALILNKDWRELFIVTQTRLRIKENKLRKL